MVSKMSCDKVGKIAPQNRHGSHICVDACFVPHNHLTITAVTVYAHPRASNLPSQPI